MGISADLNRESYLPTPVQDLQLLIQDYLEAFNSNRAKSVASFYARDAVSMPPRGPELQGPDAIAAYYLLSFAQTEPLITDYRPEWRLEGDIACVKEIWKVTLREDSRGRIERSGKGLWTARRDNGTWKIHWMLARFDDTDQI